MQSLTTTERQALAEFARLNGRRWKEALRLEWFNACQGTPQHLAPTLQSLRNSESFGPGGLTRYKL